MPSKLHCGYHVCMFIRGKACDSSDKHPKINQELSPSQSGKLEEKCKHKSVLFLITFMLLISWSLL